MPIMLTFRNQQTITRENMKFIKDVPHFCEKQKIIGTEQTMTVNLTFFSLFIPYTSALRT
jgi:hypothetical protein